MKFTLVAVRRLAALALIASLFVALVPTPAHALTERQIRNRLYEKVNNARENQHVGRLRRSDKTQTWARDHARWMSNNCTLATLGFCHDSNTELRREVPSDWQWYGENIAMAPTGSGVVKMIHTALMNSIGHRANILKDQASHFGFGVVKKGGWVYVTQRFVDRQ